MPQCRAGRLPHRVRLNTGPNKASSRHTINTTSWTGHWVSVREVTWHPAVDPVAPLPRGLGQERQGRPSNDFKLCRVRLTARSPPLRAAVTRIAVCAGHPMRARLFLTLSAQTSDSNQGSRECSAIECVMRCMWNSFGIRHRVGCTIVPQSEVWFAAPCGQGLASKPCWCGKGGMVPQVR